MVADEDILSEPRLSEKQELILYNMALRQTSQQAVNGHQGTSMLLSKLEGDPLYQEMISRGLLTPELFDNAGRSSSTVASLIVTEKGLRYCVLYASQIDPLRQFDIAGTLRETPSKGGDEDRYKTVTRTLHVANSSTQDIDVDLPKEQVRRIEEIDVQRGRMEGRVCASRYGSEGPAHPPLQAGEAGATWSFVQADDLTVLIAGVETSSKTLRIPEELAGGRVVGIAPHALSMNDQVEEIICPDSVTFIGEGAFRINARLRRLVLPANLDGFDPRWISRCPSLRELVLPGAVATITRGMFENGALERLVVGSGTSTVEPGAFQGTHLAEVRIDERNPYLLCDGTGIYTKDGAELLALVRSVRSLTVLPGCKRLAKKSCCGFAQLEEVVLPDSLEEIGPFAFSRSGLRRFDAPASLEAIDEKAFFGCRSLGVVSLNVGLTDIGDSAFENTSISELAIPRTIKSVGRYATRGTKVVHSGPERTLTMQGDGGELFLDGEGGLYSRHEDGIHLLQLIDGDLERYEVYPGTAVIDPYAVAYNDRITSVVLSAPARTIGRCAFRSCSRLAHVTLPDTVESIGEEAFLDTNLEDFYVPASLRELGDRALVTSGAHHGTKIPSLVRIDIAPENDSFFMECGMLCRKTRTGASVVVFTSSESQVVFSDKITRVEEYAFSNARGIELLSLNSRLSSIGSKGLSTWCWISHIHVELAEPLENRTCFDFFFPNTPGAVHGISLGLGGSSYVNVPGILEQLDLSLVSARNYNFPGKRENVSAYVQAKLILRRLDDPVLLAPDSRAMLEGVLRDHIVDICVDVALHDDRSVLDGLLSRGFVSADNLDEVIERVGALRDAATSSYLLEAKRQRFSQDVFDYDL